MNDNMISAMKFYDQQPLIDGMAMDPSIEELIDASMSSLEGIILSPSNSHNNTTTSGLTPKACAFKPIRRRSRASKTTPITLLKANTNNFRALVQQFTGCPTTTTTMSLAIHKGPITLNFQQPGTKQYIHHTEITTTRAMPPFDTTISSDQVSVPLIPKQQSGYCVPTNSGNSFSCMDDDELIFDNDLSLHGLTLNPINDIDGLFM